MTVLALIAPADLEDQLVSLLFSHEPTAAAGFYIGDLRHHGHSAVYRDISEQIRGHARMIRIEISLHDREVQDLLQRLSSEMPGVGIKYSVIESSAPKAIS